MKLQRSSLKEYNTFSSGLYLRDKRSLLISEGFDVDAYDYIKRVEAADGQRLEDKVAIAYNTFVLGCKADGIWNAITASCIFAGAQTLAGALTPFKGPAPTNINFVAADYNRRTGLKGDGSTKYLNTNRTGDADGSQNAHISIAGRFPPYTTNVTYVFIGAAFNGGQAGRMLGINYITASNSTLQFKCNGFGTLTGRTPMPETFNILGATRTGTGSSLTVKTPVGIESVSTVWAQGNSNPIYVYTDSTTGNKSNGRVFMYTLGNNIDLALLSTRITNLSNEIEAAIP